MEIAYPQLTLGLLSIHSHPSVPSQMEIKLNLDLKKHGPDISLFYLYSPLGE